MSLGCAMCGNCCENIRIDTVHADKINEWWVFWANGGRSMLRSKKRWFQDARFISAHWAETRRDGGDTVHKCDRFDPETRTCTAHDDRPPVCQDFPWYDDDKIEDDQIRKATMAARARVVDRSCSFLLDIPVEDRPEGSHPLIPIRAV